MEGGGEGGRGRREGAEGLGEERGGGGAWREGRERGSFAEGSGGCGGRGGTLLLLELHDGLDDPDGIGGGSSYHA